MSRRQRAAEHSARELSRAAPCRRRQQQFRSVSKGRPDQSPGPPDVTTSGSGGKAQKVRRGPLLDIAAAKVLLEQQLMQLALAVAPGR